MIGRAGTRAGVDGMGARTGRFLLSAAIVLAQATVAAAADKPAPPAASASEPVITLELPHPALLVDRLIDPRVQQPLRLLPPYRKFLEGPQFRQLQAVVTMVSTQLGTTWDRALRDLSGGGLVVRVFADKGSEPRIQAVLTAGEPKILGRVNEIFLKMAGHDATNKKKPDPVKTSDYHGVVVYLVGDDGKPKLGYAIVSGRLVLANSVKDLERLIDGVRAEAGRPAASGTKPDDEATVLRGHVDLRRLRELDPKKYTLPERLNTGLVLFIGSWYEALKQARAIDATVRWSETQLAASLELPLPKDARPASIKGYLPGPGQGPLPPLWPAGTIASLSLWRDWATIWESRADLLTPETVQAQAQLDTLAGQFFQGREFGSDVLGAFDPHWRLVVAQQDYAAMKPAPDQKLPAFAIVAELNGSQEDFGSRMRVAFQTILSISNVEAAQKKAPVFELGSEEVEGVTIATTKHVVSKKAPASSEPGTPRYNFSPSEAQVGKYVILSSSAGLARSLVRELKAAEKAGKPAKEVPATVTVEADGPELARLFEQNRSRMVMQTMLGRGETREGAEGRVGLTLALFRYLGHGRLVITDNPDRTRVDLKLDLCR